MMSQRDLAPSRAGAKASAPREDGSRSAKSSTTISKAPRCPVAERIVPFATGKSLTRGGATSTGAAEQHGHVEMVFQQRPGFDRLFVAAINKNDAFAAETDK